MKKVTKLDLKHALDSIGIQSGDRVLVHSSAMAFGRPENGLNTFLDSFQECVGETGVIAAPTFTFGFIGLVYYHYQETRSVGMGAFNETLRQLPHAFRTHHPIQSIAMSGNIDPVFYKNIPFSAYEEGGTFALMEELGFKIVLLGVSPKFISHSHLSEERCQVPYRFMKNVTGQTVLSSDENGPLEKTWGFYARFLDMPAYPHKEDLIVEELAQDGKWFETQLNGAPIATGLARDFVGILDQKLSDNPYWMLDNQEEVRLLVKERQ